MEIDVAFCCFVYRAREFSVRGAIALGITSSRACEVRRTGLEVPKLAQRRKRRPLQLTRLPLRAERFSDGAQSNFQPVGDEFIRV